MSPTTQADPPQAELAPDTGWFVYAVVPAGLELPEGLAGLDDEPVRLVVHGEVAAAVTPMALERPPGRRKELVAYTRVVDTLAGTGPVIPVRFGSVLADEEDVAAGLLEPHAPDFAVTLEELAGHAQFNVRASYLEQVVLAEVVASDPEVAELRRRTRDLPADSGHPELVRLGELVARALEHKREEDGAVVLDGIADLVASIEVRPGGGVDHVLDAAVLVPDEHRDAFEERLEGLAEAVHERMRLSLMGPMAAYDFVGQV